MNDVLIIDENEIESGTVIVTKKDDLIKNEKYMIIESNGQFFVMKYGGKAIPIDTSNPKDTISKECGKIIDVYHIPLDSTCDKSKLKKTIDGCFSVVSLGYFIIVFFSLMVIISNIFK